MQQYSTTMINSLIKENESFIFSFQTCNIYLFTYEIISKAGIGLIIAICVLIIIFEDAINACIEYLLHIHKPICNLLFNYKNDEQTDEAIRQKYARQFIPLRRSARIASQKTLC